MFRRIRLKSNNEFSAKLMRNRREEISIIPSYFIKSIKYNLEDCFELTMEVPSKIDHNGNTIKNNLYDKIKGKRFIIINDKEKYIINKISSSCEKGIRIKKITATSFEYDLAKKDLMLSTGVTRQLYRKLDEKVEVGEGILNILEAETSWKIGYVDEDAMKDSGLYDETIEIELFKDLSIENVKRETILFDKEVNMDIGENELKFSISYGGIKCTNSKGEVIKDGEKQKHDFNKFAQGIKRIKAVYGVDEKFNEVIKYEFTLNDGFVIKKEEPFTYLENMNTEFKFIYLSYYTGNKIEQKVTKYRWFDQGIRQWLPFLREDVSEAYDCIFEFNTIDKIINCYARKNLGASDKGLYLSYDNYIKSLEKEEDIDNVITRLVIEGKDGLNIASVNPLGTNYIEDFSYIINQGNMSDELQSALKRYNTLTEKVQLEWSDLKEQKNIKNQKNVYIQSKLLEQNEKKKVQEHLRIAYMKQEPPTEESKKRLEEIKVEIDKIDSEINKVMQEMSGLKDEIKVLDDRIYMLNTSIIRENAHDEIGKIFTEEDLEELDECIYSNKHQDDFYTTVNGLYENSKIILKEKNKLPISFKTDVLGITNHPRGWKNVLQLGQKGIIDDKDVINSTDDGMVRVVSFTYVPPRKNSNEEIKDIEFSNQEKKIDKMRSISDIGKKSEYTKSMTDFWKSTWYDSTKTTDFVRDIRDRGLDTAASVIRSKTSVNQIEITETGIWIKDAENTDNQLYLGSGLIGITQDGFKTVDTAIDHNSINANLLLGKAILGEKFVCSNKDNTLTIDENGLSVYDELGRLRARLGFYESSGVKKASLLLMSKDGQRVLISEDGISGNDSLMNEQNCDRSHPMYFPVDITDNIKEIRSAKLYLHFSKYRADFTGTEAGGSSISSDTSASGGGGTSSSGGGSTSTSSSGGDHRHLVFSKTGGTSNNSSTFMKYSFSTAPQGGFGMVAHIPVMPDYATDGGGFDIPNIYTYSSSGNHSHKVTVPAHTHSTPSHTHNFKLSIGSHNHPINWGIKESTTPSNVAVYVNSVKVKENINGDMAVDITKYLKLNQLNKIEISTQRNGRINALLSMSTFSSF